VSRLVALLAVLSLLMAGCSASITGAQRQPEAPDDGVQATGRIDGQRIAISDSSPETNLVDCDPGVVPDRDVCWIARTIDGVTVVFVIENPDALVPGERLSVRNATCVSCDDVTDHAVIDLRVHGEQRRAVSGFILPRQVGDRYAASFAVRFANGDELSGTFNIRAMLPGER
jgi:hypothetical protein